MENISFVIFFVLFPVACSVQRLVMHKIGLVFNDTEKAFSAILNLIIYVWISTLLYK